MAAYLSPHCSTASCTVTQVDLYQLEVEKGPEARYVSYASMRIQVNISEKLVSGFACGSPQAVDAVSRRSHEVPDLFNAEVCGRQQVLPRWTCSECRRCDEYLAASIPVSEDWCRRRELILRGRSIGRPAIRCPFLGLELPLCIWCWGMYRGGEFIALQVLGLTGIIVRPFFSALDYLK